MVFEFIHTSFTVADSRQQWRALVRSGSSCWDGSPRCWQEWMAGVEVGVQLQGRQLWIESRHLRVWGWFECLCGLSVVIFIACNKIQQGICFCFCVSPFSPYFLIPSSIFSNISSVYHIPSTPLLKPLIYLPGPLFCSKKIPLLGIQHLSSKFEDMKYCRHHISLSWYLLSAPPQETPPWSFL